MWIAGRGGRRRGEFGCLVEFVELRMKMRRRGEMGSTLIRGGSYRCACAVLPSVLIAVVAVVVASEVEAVYYTTVHQSLSLWSRNARLSLLAQP